MVLSVANTFPTFASFITELFLLKEVNTVHRP